MSSTRQLFIVAGYPGSGKSTLLLNWLHGRCVPFGDQGPPVPVISSQLNLSERSSAARKIAHGGWCSSRDIPDLNKRASLPDNLIFHLDLLLAYLSYKQEGAPFSRPGVARAYSRLFREPVFAHFAEVTLCTLDTPLPLIQERWNQRRPQWEDAGPRAEMMHRKDAMIMGPDALGAYRVIQQGWRDCLSRMAAQGTLVRSSFMPGTAQAADLQSSTSRRSQSSIA